MAWLTSSGASTRCFKDGGAYFRPGVSKATFGYFDSFAWHRVTQLSMPGAPEGQYSAGSDSSGCSSDTNAIPGLSATGVS